MASSTAPLVGQSQDLFLSAASLQSKADIGQEVKEMGSHAPACQQAQMGLDTLYVETPKGHPLCLWALDWTACARAHTHTPTHTFNHTLL